MKPHDVKNPGAIMLKNVTGPVYEARADLQGLSTGPVKIYRAREDLQGP